MTIKFYFKRPCCLERLRSGPLGIYIDQYAAQLHEAAFARGTGKHKVRLIASLSSWLTVRRLTAVDLDEERCLQFLRHRARTRIPNEKDRVALRELLAMLRMQGATPPAPEAVLDPCEHAVEQFRVYLAKERGLSANTVHKYPALVLAFLRHCFGQQPPNWQALSARGLVDYVQDCAHRQYSLAYLGLICTALRSFLGYLAFRGQVSPELVCALPTVWNWKFAMLPRHLSAEQVRQMLEHCDRSTWIGLRDYAILVLLARLGLRACEVSTLTLDDIDWRTARLNVQAKGGARVQMPLPDDVGQAIAAYLQGVPDARHAVGCSYANVPRTWACGYRSRSPRSCAQQSNAPACRRHSRARTSCGTRWPRKCFVVAPAWTRSGNCCATAVPTRPASTPRSIWTHCIPWHFLGPEVFNEDAARASRSLHHLAPRSGMQVRQSGTLPAQPCRFHGGALRTIPLQPADAGVGRNASADKVFHSILQATDCSRLRSTLPC